MRSLHSAKGEVPCSQFAASLASASPTVISLSAEKADAVLTSNYHNSWLIASLLLGLIQTWFGRFLMTADGISYLDMRQAYLHGDWSTAVNGFWNPLYAWLQAIGYIIFRPGPYWEYPIVHLVDFGVFVATAFPFEYFLAQLVRGREDETGLRFIAYALFLWSSLS